MSYEELKKFDDLCYESNVFRLWQFGAGGVIKGKNKGKPNRLLGVKRNSLCVFTTKKPFSSSLNRIVFAVSIVAGSIEGGEYEAGLVKSHEKYRLMLTDEQADKVCFWDYYQNNSEKKDKFWGTGLYRYISDEVAIAILRAIVEVKKGAVDEALAEEMLEYYLRENNLL